MNTWVSTFHIAQRGLVVESNNAMERTVRVVFPNNLNGEKVRLVLSNKYSDLPAKVCRLNIAVCDAEGKLDCSTITPITFDGVDETVLAAAQEKASDEIAFSVQAGEHLAVSMYFPEKTMLKSGSALGTAVFGGYTLRSEIGDYTREAEMPLNNGTDEWIRQMAGDQAADAPLFRSLDVLTPNGKCVAMLGDSVTQMCHWYKPLTERIYAAYPGSIATGNQGVGGSRMCFDSPMKSFGTMFGEAGYKRFQDEVATLPGLKYVMVALGGNDLGLGGTETAEFGDMLTFEQYQEAYRSIVSTAHDMGVKVIACTVTPNRVSEVGHTEDREALRRKINDWILSTDLFDAALDFSSVVGQGEKSGLNPAYDYGDGTHINEEAGRLIAESVDLRIFDEAYYEA